MFTPLPNTAALTLWNHKEENSMNEIIKKLEAEQMKAEAERMIKQYGCSEKELSRQ